MSDSNPLRDDARETVSPAHYQPGDHLYLWWLGEPQQPRLIGQLNAVRTLRGVSLRYASSWLAHGFALSEDLPLIDTEFMPTERDTAAGAVDDARPDRWGERVIRLLDRPARLSLLEYLFFAGDDRFGALGVSISEQAYRPRRFGPLPRLADVQALHAIVERVLANETVPEPQKRLITPGASLGGAHPKALLDLDGQTWVLKFAEGEALDTPLIEHASMTLAALAGIRVAETRALRLMSGHALAIRRFDRVGQRRLHALSAKVALKAAGAELSYPDLAQLLRRRGNPDAPAGTLPIYAQQMHELFRRMVFNILIDNTDDHEKNHALLVNPAGHYELSPAYDVLPCAQGLGYQQMRVGLDGADATLGNALSQANLFGLQRDPAVAEMRRVATVVGNWKQHFAACGVSARDLADLSEHIDRPFLRQQRESL